MTGVPKHFQAWSAERANHVFLPDKGGLFGVSARAAMVRRADAPAHSRSADAIKKGMI
jgi:hypothetical protein